MEGVAEYLLKTLYSNIMALKKKPTCLLEIGIYPMSLWHLEIS